MQYDMIFLLIQNKNFDQVEAEWRKVLDQKLGAKYEKQIADSLLDIVYKLSEAKQFLLAQKLLDQSLAAAPFSNKSKADILRFKALLYKESGDLDNAIKTMQQALELAADK
jgi:tetratricopeptide (TPR) repeat protein